jgi:hypothetical protein
VSSRRQRRTLNHTRVQQYVQDAIDAGYLDERLDPAVATRLMFGTCVPGHARDATRLAPAAGRAQVGLREPLVALSVTTSV